MNLRKVLKIFQRRQKERVFVDTSFTREGHFAPAVIYAFVYKVALLSRLPILQIISEILRKIVNLTMLRTTLAVRH